MQTNLNKIIVTITLLLSTGRVLFSQSARIDSLTNALNEASMKDSILICHELTKEWFDVDTKKGLFYSAMAYATSARIGDSVQLSESLVYVGMAYRRLEELDTAIG